MNLEDLPKDKKIILFDGVCHLCEVSVLYIIKRDKKDIFRFIPLQSDLGQQILQHIGVNSHTIDTMVLYESGKAYYCRADAALHTLISLGGVYSVWKIALVLPKRILNALYDYIAAHRYRWYGKNETCLIPTPEIKAKFLA